MQQVIKASQHCSKMLESTLDQSLSSTMSNRKQEIPFYINAKSNRTSNLIAFKVWC